MDDIDVTAVAVFVIALIVPACRNLWLDMMSEFAWIGGGKRNSPTLFRIVLATSVEDNFGTDTKATEF